MRLVIRPVSMFPDHLCRETLHRSRGCNFRSRRCLAHGHCKDNGETTATALNQNGYGETTAKQIGTTRSPIHTHPANVMR